MTDQELARALFEAGLLTQEQVQTAAAQRTPTQNFAQAVVNLGWVSPAQIAQFDPNALSVQTSPPTMPGAPPPTMPPAPPVQTAPVPSPASYGTSSYTVPGVSSTPSQAGVVDTSAISEGWQILSSNLGVWIGATVIAGIIAIVYSQITGLVTNRMMPDPTTVDPSNMMPYIAGMLPAISIGNFLGIPLNAFLYGGFTAMGLNQLRRGTVSIGDLFSAGPYMIQLMIFSFILQFVSFAYLLCCIPGLILNGLMLFALPLMIERKMNALEAISTSWNALKGQIGSLVVLMILLSLLILVSAIPCGLGLLVTLPLWVMTVMVLYNRFFPADGSNAPQDQSNYPPPPIPSPF
jgi:uncharacterized membrane protein